MSSIYDPNKLNFISYKVTTVSGKEYNCISVIEFPAYFDENNERFYDAVLERTASLIHHRIDGEKAIICNGKVESIEIIKTWTA